jgi:glycosyltransferase involved in cell wall biosynthesis
MSTGAGRILTINSHEAWVYQLGYLGDAIDIVDGMPGRYCPAWDTRVRPIPERATLVKLDEVLARQQKRDARPYDCIVGHSVTDLMDLKEARGPRILVLHVTLEGRARNEGSAEVPAGYAQMVRQYLDMVGAPAMAVSTLKAQSWGIDAPVVPFAVDIDGYLAHKGSLASGIRVANQVSSRKDYLAWGFHQLAFRNIPVRLIGHNPDMPGVTPAESWDDLKSLLSEHRFFVHTAHPELEDGYNMATVEAMAAGLPVLGNVHPSSPIEHGISGFLSDDPQELADYARRLLAEPALAHGMGQAARETARARFSVPSFVEGFREVARAAERNWKRRNAGA